MYNLSLKNVMFGHFSNTSNITRFSCQPRILPESVAEHSFWVGTLSFLMALHYERVFDPAPIAIDWKALAFKSSFHDMEETISGDFPRPFKHSTPELNQAIERAAKIAAERVSCTLSKALSQKIYAFWETAKDTTLEGRIVALADYLSVIRWGIREKQMGNSLIARELHELSNYVDFFNDESFDPIREYVQQAKELTEELLNGRS
ncbi:MAG: YfbR-like 5'-deoxynucleotidase [Kiritimatiellales bacterium]